MRSASPRRFSPLALAGAFLTGCGMPTFIVIEVNSDLSPPTEIDQINLVLRAPPPESESHFQTDMELTSEHTFPLQVGITPSAATPHPELLIIVTGRLQGDDVARVAAVTDWQWEVTNVVRLAPLASRE